MPDAKARRIGVPVSANQIEPPPCFGANVNTDFILGLAKVGEKVVILLDADRVLAAAELAAVGQMGEEDEG